MIDSFAEGLIDKEQFTSRMTRAKSRIAELDAEISADSGDADHQDRMRGLASRLRGLAATVAPDLEHADWARRREIIRTLVQRIEIGPEKVAIVFRVSPDDRGSRPESIFVTLSRA
jgi:site-specific DNA recombinase